MARKQEFEKAKHIKKVGKAQGKSSTSKTPAGAKGKKKPTPMKGTSRTSLHQVSTSSKTMASTTANGKSKLELGVKPKAKTTRDRSDRGDRSVETSGRGTRVRGSRKGEWAAANKKAEERAKLAFVAANSIVEGREQIWTEGYAQGRLEGRTEVLDAFKCGLALDPYTRTGESIDASLKRLAHWEDSDLEPNIWQNAASKAEWYYLFGFAWRDQRPLEVVQN